MLSDLLVMDQGVSGFQAASGDILNRNRKSVILGLGSWTGKMDWPMQWISAMTDVKLYGGFLCP